MSSISKSRNGELDFWKFIFSIVIVLHHSYSLFDGERHYFQFGSLAVEFFFIVSGYFFAASVMKNKQPYDPKTIGSETGRFIFKKFYGIFFFFIFAVILKLIINIISSGFSKTVLNHKFLTIIFDCLFLNVTGLETVNIIGATWYISAMLLAMAVLYPIIRKNPDLFMSVISPVTAVFLYGMMMKNDGYLGDPYIWYSFIYKGVVRAFAGIALGCFAYKLSELMKTNPLITKTGRLTPHILSAADIVFLAGSVYGMSEITKLNCETQPVIVFAFAAGVTICASRTASISKLFSHKFFTYLGKLSMTVYFCHACILGIMSYAISKIPAFAEFRAVGMGYPITATILVAGSIILGIICLAVCEPIKKKFDAYILKLKEKE